MNLVLEEANERIKMPLRKLLNPLLRPRVWGGGASCGAARWGCLVRGRLQPGLHACGPRRPGQRCYLQPLCYPDAAHATPPPTLPPVGAGG
jgi:hypothetical protein